MSRPKVFRDPVHGQIRYAVARGRQTPTPETRFGELMLRLVDSREFQRLRSIRQLGLAHLVFHGAEHSRFNHSMGVGYLAEQMYDRIVRNMDQPIDWERRMATCAAALLHDLGHGPFSHTLEEALKPMGHTFDHEVLTCRMMLEEGTEVHRHLREIDPAFPSFVAGYIDRGIRWEEHWSHKIVSSQLDADRLDYLLRDAYFIGMRGHGFDLERILDMLGSLDQARICVDRRATGAIDAYLLSLDHMFSAVYFHHTLRAAVFMMGSLLRRAVELHLEGAKDIFPGPSHPLVELLTRGTDCDLDAYVRLTEYPIYTLIDGWQEHGDAILADLARRIMGRRIFKTVDVYDTNFETLARLREQVRELTRRALSHLSEDETRYYIGIDEPERTSYKKYNWVHEQGNDESIWITGGTKDPTPIEQEQRSIVAALKNATYSKRLIFPPEVQGAVVALMEG